MRKYRVPVEFEAETVEQAHECVRMIDFELPDSVGAAVGDLEVQEIYWAKAPEKAKT